MLFDHLQGGSPRDEYWVGTTGEYSTRYSTQASI